MSQHAPEYNKSKPHFGEVPSFAWVYNGIADFQDVEQRQAQADVHHHFVGEHGVKVYDDPRHLIIL